MDTKGEHMRRMSAVVMGAVLAVSACTSEPEDAVTIGSIDDIVVGVDEVGAPTLEYVPGNMYIAVETRTEWDGTGDFLNDGDPVLLNLYAISLKTGAVISSTWHPQTDESAMPSPYLVAPEVLGQELYDVLIGKRVGIRVVHVSPPADDFQAEGAIAFVVDVLPSRAVGLATEARDDLPIVTAGPLGEPTITLRPLDAPADLVIATLIQGDGEQIRAGSYVMVNYVGVYYYNGNIFDSSWPVERAPFETRIGVSAVIQGWDIGLIDHAAGSQVLLIIPPELAYGEDTLVFVIDILAVWNAE